MAHTRNFSSSDVSVVVPVGGPAPAWRRSSRSLSRLDPAPAEIVVVIDGTNDEHAAVAAEIGATVEALAVRGGPARARNRGAELATGEILLFVDSDVEVSPDLAARVAELFSADSELTAVVGSYDDVPGDPAFLSQYRNLLHHFVHQSGREQASTFWGGCGAIRRRAFLDIGSFDESYANPSIEDIELGSRLRAKGHAIRMVKSLQVTHLKRWRLVEMLKTDLFRRAVPWTELMLADGRLVNDLNVTTRDRISVFLAAIAVAGIAAGWLWPPLLGVAAAALALVLAFNFRFFRFLSRCRGIPFAVGAFPLYLLYLLICGLGFAMGFVRHVVGSRRRERARLLK
jgi:cellulose synthase/poly-beta-1,6-N-acetylglucosamine synthase-like glycosyltransferase